MVELLSEFGPGIKGIGSLILLLDAVQRGKFALAQLLLENTAAARGRARLHRYHSLQICMNKPILIL